MLRGKVAHLKWSYYPAATMRDYIVRRSADGQWRLRAVLETANAFNLRQTPLFLVAPYMRPVKDEKGTVRDHTYAEWRWPVLSLKTEGNIIAASLGDGPL